MTRQNNGCDGDDNNGKRIICNTRKMPKFSANFRVYQNLQLKTEQQEELNNNFKCLKALFIKGHAVQIFEDSGELEPSLTFTSQNTIPPVTL